MKVVRIKDGVVEEIIPDYALPVEKWYGEEFSASCVEAPDEVDQRWVYNASDGTFSSPSDDQPKPEPTEAQLLGQEITAMELESIAQGQKQTALELDLLEQGQYITDMELEGLKHV